VRTGRVLGVRGKWAQGIEPRHFRWIIKDRLAVCERPGGYGDSHRRVRRQEEIIWLRQNHFDRVLSLIPSSHNLHNYAELDMPFRHVPFAGSSDGPEALTGVLATIRDHLMTERIIVHREELGERVAGVVAAYLLWMGLVPSGPAAITVTEQLLERELGPVARELVALVARIPPASAIEPGSTLLLSTPIEAPGGDGEGRDAAVAADLAVDESSPSS
jgi:hypothetical protein